MKMYTYKDVGEIKRTLMATIYNEGRIEYKVITCRVYGEMADGRKVWEDVETGNQYIMVKAGKRMIFAYM